MVYKGLATHGALIEFDGKKQLLDKLRWTRTHDVEAKAIMFAGQKFAEDNLSLKELYHYVIELLRKYEKNYKSQPHQVKPAYRLQWHAYILAIKF